MVKTKEAVKKYGLKKIADIIISANNARNIVKNDPGIKSLAESIKATEGVINPVTVRPHPKIRGKYELLAGRRRLMASKLAGYKEIKTEVVEADDQRALVIITAENLQRENLTPLEEAEQLKKLLEANNDPRAIAADLGRPAQWIARRARLLNLSPEWFKAAKKKYSKWSAVHLELIARYDVNTQNSFFKHFDNYYSGDWSVSVLEAELAKLMHQLKKAPWQADDETLIPQIGSCLACPKRSSREPLLFGDDDDEKEITDNDRCLDAVCWNKKLKEHTDVMYGRLKEQHPDLVKVSVGWNYPGSTTHDDSVLKPNEYEVSNKKYKGAIPALVVGGAGTGSKIWIKVDGGTPARQKKKPEKPPAGKSPTEYDIETRQLKLKHRRNSHIVLALKDKLINEVKFYNAGVGFEDVKDWRLEQYLYLICLATVIGTKGNNPYPGNNIWKEIDGLSKKDAPTITSALWDKIAPILRDRLFYSTADQATERIPEVKHICELVGVDFGELQKDAEKACPVSKVLKNLIAGKDVSGDKDSGNSGKEKAKAKLKPTSRKLAEIAEELGSVADKVTFVTGRKIKIIYDQAAPDSFDSLSANGAEKYLAWLKAGNTGKFGDMAD